MKHETPITDSDLHAWVDGQLSEARRQQVEAWFQSHPDKLREFQKYQELNCDLKILLDPIIREPVPESLRIVPRSHLFRRIAAAMGFLIIGGLAGWQANNLLMTGNTQLVERHLIRPAVFAHVVYSAEKKHPVEVGAEQEQHLINWLSKRLHTTIKAPNLLKHGYELVGGRLLPSTDRMAAQFMYQTRSGNRITLYLRRVKNIKVNARFQFTRSDGVNTFYWVEGDLGYALSGELNRHDLLNMANTSFQQLQYSLKQTR